MFASPAKPRGTPRRRPKTPGGTLGAKLRQRVLEVFPSSLPPSSPIPTSSRHPSSDDTEQPIVYSDFGSLVLEENAQEDDSGGQEDDDPFGFFSVERKLRAIRAAQPLPQPQHLETSPARQPMPSTPHKPKLGTVMHASATSSPSPVKRRGDDTPDPASESESESDQPPPPPKRSSRKRTRVTEDKDKDKDKPAKRGKSTMDRDLDSDLPKPPKTRRSARVLASNSKATSKPASTKPTSVVKAKPASKSIKSARKGKGKEKENVENDDEEEEDAEQRERLARIAYFKKLDDYSFEKENVYVV